MDGRPSEEILVADDKGSLLASARVVGRYERSRPTFVWGVAVAAAIAGLARRHRIVVTDTELRVPISFWSAEVVSVPVSLAHVGELALHVTRWGGKELILGPPYVGRADFRQLSAAIQRRSGDR